MIALDLFCGAGGASKGLLNAGFRQVTGVDIEKQPEYCSKFFWQENVFDFLNYTDLDCFKFIWASPPCQAYSVGTIGYRNKGKKYIDLIGKTRKLLLKTGKPFVIENVPGSPLRKDLLLCGEMFGLPIIRHRWFEIHGFKCEQPKHEKHKRKVTEGTAVACWTGGRPGCFGDKEKRAKLKPATLKQIQKAMKIDWIADKTTLCQCVPPAYAEYIGRQFLNGDD